MNALEREIIEKFNQLDPDARKRIRQLIQNDTTITQSGDTAFNFEVWLSEVATLQSDIQAHLGEGQTVGALSLLDELREESS